MESSKETPGGPILCINNCGFFGSAATMNMCSKCHREIISKQEQAKLAASSFENIVNGNSSSSNDKEPLVVTIDVQNKAVDVDVDVNVNVSNEKCLDFSLGQNSEVEAKEGLDFSLGQNSEVKAKGGPNRCITCHKRVGLTGFNCKCGNLFCGMHRYSDKHDCTFDYRASGQAAIAKENPVVKAKKLDKI